MGIHMIGISHQQAALSVRERASFTQGAALQAIEQLHTSGIACVLLSTCNRTELYASAPNTPDVRSRLAQVLLKRAGDTQALLERLLVYYHGYEAVRHLFFVCAGLHSLVAGEDQILGQVQRAFEAARCAGCTDKALHILFQNAIEAARRTKTTLQLGQQARSVCAIAMRCAHRLQPIPTCRALVLGSGETAQLAITYLKNYGARSITVCCRSRHAQLTHAHPDLTAHGFSARYQMAAESDLIICATSAPHLVLSSAALAPAAHPRIIVDLGAPRNADSTLAQRENITLIDLDSLAHTAQENDALRADLAAQAADLLNANAQETFARLQNADAERAIGVLQQRCLDAERSILQMLADRLSLSAHEQRHVEKIVHAGIRRISRDAILRLKQLETESLRAQYSRAVYDLFQANEVDYDL